MVIGASGLIIDLILGGLTGYLVNLLGFKMLKLEMTNSHVQEISTFIEKELVNENTLESELKKAEFKNTITGFINEFIKNDLSANIPDKNFSEIPGSENTFINLNEALTHNFVGNGRDRSLLEKIKITEILNSSQLKKLSNSLYDIIFQSVNPELKPFLISLYEEMQDKPVSELISNEILDPLIANTEPFLNNLHNRIYESDEELNKVIGEFLKILNLEKWLEELEEYLKNKTLLEIIGTENKDELNNELIQHFISFINTEDGKKFLDNLSITLIELSKKIDKPILTFLNPALQVKMFVFLEKNLPYLADTAKEWLRINKAEIEHLIENSIDEYYSNQDFWGQIKLTIKDVIGLKIAEYFEVVEKAIAKLESYINNNAIGDLTNEVVKFLENKQLGNLITELDLKPERLSDFFGTLIQSYLPKLNTSIFDGFFNKKLSGITGLFKPELKSILSEKIHEFLLKQIKYQFFYTQTFSNKVQEVIKEKISGLKESKISDLLPKEKFDGYISFLPMLLMFSKQKLLDALFQEIQRQVSDKNLASILNDEIKESLNTKIEEIYKTKVPELTSLLKEVQLKAIYEIFTKDFNFNHDLESDKIKPFFTGKISAQVKPNLEKITSVQIKSKLDEIRKKEGKNSVLISTAVGASTGILVYFINPSGNAELIILPASFAITGIFANWLYLKSILRPYVISRQKAQFAKTIGSFISQKLITPETIKNIFKESRIHKLSPALSSQEREQDKEIYLFSSLSKRGIRGEFQRINHSIINKISESKEGIAKYLIEKVSSFELRNIKQETFARYFSAIIKKGEGFVGKFLTSKISGYRQQTLKNLPGKLTGKTSEVVENIVKKKLDEFITLVNQEEILEQKIGNSLKQLDNIIDFRIRLESFINLDKKGNIKEKTISSLNDVMKNKVKDGIHKYINHIFIEDKLNPEKDIRGLFNGELLSFIKRNIHIAVDSVIFGLGLERLKEEKGKIADKIIGQVREANKDSMLYGFGESFLNIETDIREIVHLIIDNKLEPYLKDKKWELENILTGFVDFISGKKLDEIGMTEDILNEENIEFIINSFLDNENILESIYILSKALVDDILKYELGHIFNLIGLKSLENIPDKFKNEIRITKTHFFNNLESNKENISENLSKLAAELLEKHIYSLPLSSLFTGIDDSKISEVVDRIVHKLFSSNTFENYKNKFSNTIYEKISEKKAGDLFDATGLEKDLATALQTLIENDDFKTHLESIIEPLVTGILGNLDNILEKETKEFIIKIYTESIIESFTKHSEEIHKALNISEVVTKEIENMPSEKIEVFIKSIASEYFQKFVMYGLIGGIIGIIAAIINL